MSLRKGLQRRRLYMAIALVLVLGATTAWAKIMVGQCLPPSGAVAGWQVIEGTYKECPDPSGLPDLYDGGWERYRDAGIVKAATQSYKKADRQAVIYAHEFSGADKAGAYYQAQVKAARGKVNAVRVAAGSAAYWVAGPATVGHVVRGKVHATVSAMGNGADVQQAVAGFLADISNRIGQVYK